MTINSYGIILYRDAVIPKGIAESPSGVTDKEYLLVCRKDSVSYVVFLRGLYDNKMVPALAERMTKEERDRIKTQPFDLLWDRLWQYHPSRKYHHRQKFRKQKERAKDKFDKRDWELIFDSIDTTYDEPEWGFPKGRKKKMEKPIQAALREFNEETGVGETDIVIHREIPPLIEKYIGTDSKHYQIMYFVAKMIDPLKELPIVAEDDTHQLSEISTVAWFTKKDALKKIRNYHVEKKALLQKLKIPATNVPQVTSVPNAAKRSK